MLSGCPDQHCVAVLYWQCACTSDPIAFQGGRPEPSCMPESTSTSLDIAAGPAEQCGCEPASQYSCVASPQVIPNGARCLAAFIIQSQ